MTKAFVFDVIPSNVSKIFRPYHCLICLRKICSPDYNRNFLVEATPDPPEIKIEPPTPSVVVPMRKKKSNSGMMRSIYTAATCENFEGPPSTFVLPVIITTQISSVVLFFRLINHHLVRDCLLF